MVCLTRASCCVQVEEVGVEEVGVTPVEEEVMVVGQEGTVVEEVVGQQAVPLASSVVRRVTGPGNVHKTDQLGEVEGVTVVEEKEEVIVEEEAVQQAVPPASSVVRKVTGPGTVHRVHQGGEVEGGLLGGKTPHRTEEGEVDEALLVLEHATSAANQGTSAMPVLTKMTIFLRTLPLLSNFDPMQPLLGYRLSSVEGGVRSATSKQQHKLSSHKPLAQTGGL